MSQKTFVKSRAFKYGVPFLTAIVLGSFGLREFSEVRYKFSQKTSLNSEEFKKLGIKVKKPGEVTLESEYEKIKNLDTENWVQVRGPRPWEEQQQQQQTQK